MNTNVKSISKTEVRAVVTRADGTVEDFGLISAKYRNPLRQLRWLLFGKPKARRLTESLNMKAGN